MVIALPIHQPPRLVPTDLNDTSMTESSVTQWIVGVKTGDAAAALWNHYF